MKSSTHDAPLIPSASTYFLAGFILFLTLITLTGWFTTLPYLNELFPEWKAMQPNTIACFLLFSVALGLLPLKNSVSKTIIAVCVLLAMAIALSNFYFNINEFIPGLTNVGRMSYLTSANFLIIGVAFLLLMGNHRAQAIAQYFFIFSLFIPLPSFMSYLYSTSTFMTFPNLGAMSFITDILFLLFSPTALFSNPTPGVMTIFKGSAPGNVLAKYVIPTAILIPIIFGYIHFLGAPTISYVNALDFAQLIFSITISFVLVTWFSAVELNKMNEKIKQGDRDLALAAAKNAHAKKILDDYLTTPIERDELIRLLQTELK